MAANQAADCTLSPVAPDRARYRKLMQRDDVEIRCSPTLEVEWLAFRLSVRDPEYETAPSKLAATWLRQLRMKKDLRAKFWTDTWPYYMENRLSLELRAAQPRKPLAVVRRRGPMDASPRRDIERLLKSSGQGNGDGV